MQTDDAVKALQEAATEAARHIRPLADTPETRAAYARGVRAMAGLVHACIGVAQDGVRENRNNPAAVVMLQGYARALRHIVDAAEGLIPPGYE